MCAPLAPPCCASYIDALTRSSCNVSGAGVGSALPIERYTEDALGSTPALVVPLDAVPPVLFTTREEVTWRGLLPLKRLLASTPLRRKLFEVSRWPLAQIGALPRPLLAPVPPGNSAFTPVDKMARPVKLPVASGMVSICCLSSTYPLVVSTAFIRGEASTVTDSLV